jgi:hypothetical protein
MSVAAVAAAGYSLLLVVFALGLDRLARHSHHRSGRFRTAGFTYRSQLDAWECPEGQHLHKVELDHHRRMVRYRGKPQICNACPAKDGCTDSDQGREIVTALDPWPHSEAGRFHRGISVVLLLLASLVAAGGLVLDHSSLALTVLGCDLCLTVSLLLHMTASFRTTPANFPATPGPIPR